MHTAMEEISVGKAELNECLQQKKDTDTAAYSLKSFPLSNSITSPSLRFSFNEGCPDVKDVSLRAGKWEKLCVICVLPALKAMLPNKFIFGFHRGVRNGQRGADLS